MSSIPVQCPGGAYEIAIEPGGLASIGPRIASIIDSRNCLLVLDAAIGDPHGTVARCSLENAGFEVSEHTIVADENLKTIATVESIYQAALGAGLDRHAVIVALGGGLIGDVAGFAAASFLRGVNLVQAPTTLLAMVDASVGGKTGVNLPLPKDASEADRLGKNLAGAFWQPRLVLVDPAVLETLPPRERRCGLAECIKHGLIDAPHLLEFIGFNHENILAAQPDAITLLVDQAVRVKISVVEEDEREHGRRAVLNLGHTFAHAIEPIAALDLKHGEAVAIGLVAAIALAQRLDRLEGDWANDITKLIQEIGLPVRLPAPVPVSELLLRMGFDKKTRDGRHTLVVPRCPGQIEIVQDVRGEDLVAAWLEVGAG